MTLGFDQIPVESFVLLGVSLVALIFTCIYALRPYRRAARDSGASYSEEEACSDCPSASVVIYCRSDEETLMSALESVCSQDYPDYDVVVVCDAGMEYAGYITELVESRWSNVYVTFLQPGSHNLSRRKLANTIGIKAAKGKVVITTQANIKIPSDRWLSGMMKPFCGEQGRHIDVVLGLSHIDFAELRGPGKWYGRFDSVLSDALWVGFAYAGHPYRGDCFNLALRRDVFFSHKGYANNMFLLNGEDDVYLQEICNASNTRMVCFDDTVLTTGWGDSANRMRSFRKASYAFTSRWLPRAPFVRAALADIMQWVVPALALAGALTGAGALWPCVMAGLMVAGLWTADILCYSAVSRIFGLSRISLAVPLFWMWRPFANLFFKLAHIGTYKKNFTWQR